METNFKKSKKLIYAIQNGLYSKKLILPSQKILLSISGGQDSSCLIFIFIHLKEKFKYFLGLTWCNHLWQTDSFYIMFHIVKVAFLTRHSISIFIDPKIFFAKKSPLTFFYFFKIFEKYKQNICIFCPQTTTTKKIELKSTEETARNWRYQANQRGAHFYNHSIIMRGHTASDQIETSLFKIMRGSSNKGISSFHWSKKCKNIYPKNFMFSNFSQINIKQFKYGIKKRKGFWFKNSFLK